MKRLLTIIGYTLIIVVIAAIGWLATTDNSWVWPRRNFVEYEMLTRLWPYIGEPQIGDTGGISGVVFDYLGRPINGGWVVFSRWDGTTYAAQTDAKGRYAIADIPAGEYAPIVGAAGFAPKIMGGRGVVIEAGQNRGSDVVLAAAPQRRIATGSDFALDERASIACETPINASANRQNVTFTREGEPNQQTLLYTPIDATPEDLYPLLITVYPGPADTWECASVPLAAAGYNVIAVGPAYNLELESDVDDLERILDFVAAGYFPNVSDDAVSLLGGSYSGLHVQILLRRGRQDIQSAVLLGAPTDIYAMRRYLEEGIFIPPFGLDQVLVALGLPDRQPLRYWEGSSIYHVQPDFPPHLIIHSRDDAVVPISQSELLTEQLVQAQVTHQTHYFDEASHYLLSAGGESREIYDLAVNFLAEQYDRPIESE
ncbi:MAG: carboxypeptidase regulatory-like domain-containing protein [Chloroflexota bacterium]